MSLDIYLTMPATLPPQEVDGGRIYVRQNGRTREITRQEWDQHFPGTEPFVATVTDPETVYNSNITHNLGAMARQAGLYTILWRPEEAGIKKASQLAEPLTEGLRRLKADPVRFKAHNPPNGWGTYEGFVHFVEEYLEMCMEYPDADVDASR